MIQLKHIHKTFTSGHSEQPVLNNVSLQIAAGECLSLMGPSGSGKSTLLYLLGLLDQPDSGHYTLLGQDTTGLSNHALATLRNQTIGFVFQQFYLLPHLTALQNVALPLLYNPNPPHHGNDWSMHVLEQVEMADWAQHRPTQLSGGQQQRVAIARALINQPKLILADEPTGALDAKTGQTIMDTLKACNRQGTTLIIVTHDERISQQCHRTIRVHQGKISC